MLGLLVWLLAAAPASAAEVHMGASCYRERCDFRAVYTAAPGEANRLTVERTAANTLVFRDPGAVVQPGRGCAASGDAVVCTDVANEYFHVEADLGDGDDTGTGDGTIDGGPGDDEITAGVTGTGGPGRDVVRGAFIVDADGARPARDRYEGAESVSYADRRAGIRIDLRGGRAGEDVLVGVQGAIGGRGDDVLIGTARANELDGGPGDDRVVALGGDDKVTAWGRDRVDAGAGRDEIQLGTKDTAVRLDCGPGSDGVVNLTAPVRLTDCERLELGLASGVRLRTTLPRAGAALLTVKECRCVNGRYVVYHGRETIGAARGRFKRLVLRLNTRGRFLLARDRRLAVRVEFHEHRDVEGFRTVLALSR